MSTFKIEDIRFSSSSIDDFFAPRPTQTAKTACRRIRISGLHQLADFEAISNDKLVRVSQKDFWKLGQDEAGYFIERLVNDDSGPIRET